MALSIVLLGQFVGIYDGWRAQYAGFFDDTRKGIEEAKKDRCAGCSDATKRAVLHSIRQIEEVLQQESADKASVHRNILVGCCIMILLSVASLGFEWYCSLKIGVLLFFAPLLYPPLRLNRWKSRLTDQRRTLSSLIPENVRLFKKVKGEQISGVVSLLEQIADTPSNYIELPQKVVYAPGSESYLYKDAQK